jgi:hypothetical protein
MVDPLPPRDLVAGVLDVDVAEPLGAYVFGPHDAGAELGRLVERAVFLEAFGNTSEMLDDEYSPYEQSSLYFCVVDHRRRTPAGMIRIILPDPPVAGSGGAAGLKSLVDLEACWGEPATALLARTRVPLAPPPTWDNATLTVMPAYRGSSAAGLVSLGLYQSVVRAARQAGIDWMVAILDLAVYRMSRQRFQSPFVPFAEARTYLGSQASLPVSLHVSDWKRRLGANDAAIHDIVFEATGLEAAMRPLDLASPTLEIAGAGARLSAAGVTASAGPAGGRHVVTATAGGGSGRHLVAASTATDGAG